MTIALLVSSLTLTGCELWPSALQALPLKSEFTHQHQMRARLQPQAQIFVGVEYEKELYEHDASFLAFFNTVVSREFSAYFPGAVFHKSHELLAPDQWFQNSNRLAPQADYLIVLRLVSVVSNNVVRMKECHSDELQQHPPLKAFSEMHPFGPGQAHSHSSTSTALPKDSSTQVKSGVVYAEQSELDRLISAFDLEEPLEENTPKVTLNPETSDIAGTPGENQRSVQVDQRIVSGNGTNTTENGTNTTEVNVTEVSNQKDDNANFIAQEINKDQPLAVNLEAHRSSSLEVEYVEVEYESCGLGIGSGRDELSIAASLYTQHQRMLIDHALLQAQAGIAGWQFETTKDLLTQQIRALAARYAGK